MVVPTSKAIDTKREEFRKYCEKEGVLEQLTKTLLALYEEPEKPSNAVAFISKSIASDDLKALKVQIEDLTKENVELKSNNETLKLEKLKLVEEIAELKGCTQKANDTPIEAVEKVSDTITDESVKESSEAVEDSGEKEVENPLEPKEKDVEPEVVAKPVEDEAMEVTADNDKPAEPEIIA